MTDTPAARGSLWVKLHEIFGLDLRSLALFRVLIGVLLLGELASRLPDFRAHYCDDGIVPIRLLQETLPVSIHVLNGSMAYQLLLWGLAFVVAVMLTIGWRTQLAVLLSWFLLVSVQARNSAILHNGDGILRMCLFFAIFLPLGAVWSFDSRFRPRPTGVGPLVLNGGTIAYLLQLCFVYWFAVIWKSAPEWRSEFSAVFYAMHVDTLVLPPGVWLRAFPGLCYLLTIATMLVEAVGPLLVLFPFATQWMRLIGVVTLIGLHVGFAAFLALGTFGPVCCIAWLPILPPLFWTLLGRWCDTPARRELVLRTALPEDQRGRLEGFRAFLLLPMVRIEAGTTGGIDGPLVKRMLWNSPVFWPLTGLFPASILSSIATWLQSPGRPASSDEVWRARFVRPLSGAIPNTIVLFCLTLVLAWNVRTVAPEAVASAFPPQVNSFCIAIALDQCHDVFAPHPAKVHGWFVLIGRLKDGREVDLRWGTPPDQIPDVMRYQDAKSIRWRALFLSMRTPRSSALVPYYADWIRREWDREHPDNPVVVLDVTLHTRPVRYPDGLQPIEKTWLYRYSARTTENQP